MEIKKGAVDQTIYFEILDSTSTSGGRKTGLVFNTAGLVASYVRTRGLRTAITLATLAAADSAHSDGGFKEVDATNMPGVYRLDLPDAAVATGAEEVVITLQGATGMAQVSRTIQLVTNIASDVIADTDDIQTRLPAALVSGRMDSSVGAMAANTLTATAIAADAITAAKIADNAIDAGAIAADAITAAKIANGAIDAATFAAGAIDAAAIATGAIDADAIAADAVTEIQSGLSTLDAAGIRTAVGLAVANLDTQLAAIDDAVDTEIATLVTNVATILAAVDTEVAAIKAKTDNLPASPAATGDIPSAAAITADILAGTITELAAVPGASPALKDALAFLYMAVRNKRDTTGSTDEIHNDAGGVIATAALSDDGTTFTKGEYA